ncbi:MAG: hypothetical protein JWP25_8240 [Bradyrhizobium sp.]|nr:hypothetical protein [Bradyrhizobium sp.]
MAEKYHGMAVSQNDVAWIVLRLDLIALRLGVAAYRKRRTMAYQLQRRNHVDMSAQELREALRGTPGAESLTIITAANGNQVATMAGQTFEFWPMATNAEILETLSNPFIRTGETNSMSITGFQPGAVKAAIEAAQQGARDRQAKSMARLAEAGAKAAGVADAIDQVSAKIEQEADDALAELAQFTNGGPA